MPKGLDSLNTLIKTSVSITVEVVIDHLIDLLDEDPIHLFQQTVTGGIPLVGGYLDESLCNDVQRVIWELPGSSPVKE